MRGLTHYISGLAIATFFKSLVIETRAGSLVAAIPAIFAYLPDFFDFKIWKFFEKWDYNIDPAPVDPETNRAPKLVKVGELKREDRYRLFSIAGKVANVREEDGRLEFLIEDESGRIKVVAVNEDKERLLKTLDGLPRAGEHIKVSGYLDYENEEPIFVVSDSPHPMFIAEKVAKAIDEAYETGRDVRVKLQTIRMIGDVYRRYLVDLDWEHDTVRVVIGPIVTVGGVPIEGTEVPEYRRVAEVKTKHPFVKKYPKPTVIDAFSGPSIGFKKGKDRVEELFLPWHREWSHSFVTGAVLAAILYILATFIGYANAADLALASMFGFWIHIIEDHLGFMGGNLFYPFTNRRFPGFGIGESGSAALNFATAWLMFDFIIANFNRYSERPPIPLDYPLLVAILSTPSIILYSYAIYEWLKTRKIISREEEEVREALEEEEEEIGSA